jgi:hypothetical protein
MNATGHEREAAQMTNDYVGGDAKTRESIAQACARGGFGSGDRALRRQVREPLRPPRRWPVSNLAEPGELRDDRLRESDGVVGAS